MLASSNSKMLASSTSVRTMRKGQGSLVHEGMPGLDAMHDWYQSDTIAGRCSAVGNMGGRCSPPGKPNWALNTKVPRPWQKAPDLRYGRQLGPGSFDSTSRPHLISSPSRAVTARLGPHSGRVGGRPFEEPRLSTAFSSVTLRNLTQSDTKQPSKQVPRSTPPCCTPPCCTPLHPTRSTPAPHPLRTRSAPALQIKEDFFILRSDNRRDSLQRGAWSQTLSRRVHTDYLARPPTAPPPRVRA